MGNKSLLKEVWLVDDAPIDLFINEQLLSAYGFANQFMVFESAQEALQEFSSRCKNEKPFPQVIFLDYFMPSINGLEFLNRLKDLIEDEKPTMEIPKIVMLTTLKEPEKRKTLEQQELVFTIMSKPLSEKAVSALSALILSQASH